MNAESKCPSCGNFGVEVSQDIFRCIRCDLMFNEFGVSTYSEIKDHDLECN